MPKLTTIDEIVKEFEETVRKIYSRGEIPDYALDTVAPIVGKFRSQLLSLIGEVEATGESLKGKLVDRDTNFGMNESYRLAIDDLLSLIQGMK